MGSIQVGSVGNRIRGTRLYRPLVDGRDRAEELPSLGEIQADRAYAVVAAPGIRSLLVGVLRGLRPVIVVSELRDPRPPRRHQEQPASVPAKRFFVGGGGASALPWKRVGPAFLYGANPGLDPRYELGEIIL